jgi:hypothetical protein
MILFQTKLNTYSIFTGGFLGYLLSYLTTARKLNDLENQLSTLREQMENLQATQKLRARIS